MCSGADLMMLPELLQNTVEDSSWTMTWAGTNQDPLFRDVFHTITQSPGWYIPLWGLARRNAALRIDMSLSAAWKAFLADSRMAKTVLNRMACSSSPATTACVGRVSSPTMEPGTLRPRPKTNVSGEKPMRNPLAFLAMVQRVRAYCICL